MIEFILYVKDQDRSSKFYSAILRKTPVLNVPGMTEFLLNDNCKLGLMPEENIKNIFKNKLPDPADGNGIPRCELYLYVDDVMVEQESAVLNGARLISATENRSWGDKVCYLSDPDGHIIAFAAPINV